MSSCFLTPTKVMAIFLASQTSFLLVRLDLDGRLRFKNVFTDK